MRQLTQNEINELFHKLNLPKKNSATEKFEVWEVPPIKKEMHLYTSSD